MVIDGLSAEDWSMTVIEFNLLAVSDKLDLIYKQGIYIGKQKTTDGSILLYQLDSFYTEIIYTMHRKYVAKINCFTSIDRLDPYLDQVSIEAIIAQ